MRGGWRLLAGCALLSPGLLLVAAQVAPAFAFPFAMAVNAVSVLVTSIAMGYAARHGDPRLRRARRWFTIALVAGAVGLLSSAVHSALVDHIPVILAGGAFPLVWVPCALVGLFSIPSEQYREGGRPRAALDSLAVTAALGMLFWMLFLGPIYRMSDQSGLVKVALVGFPVADFVLAVAAFAVAAHARADLRRFLHLATVGLLLIAVADAGSAAAGVAGHTGFDWTNVVQQAALAILLCAALLPTGEDLNEQRNPATVAADAALPHVPLVLAVLVALQQHFTGHALDSVVMSLGSGLVLALVARQVLYANHLAAIADRLSVDARRDSLTGLANRRWFLGALDTALAERQPGEVAVALLDLDGFKEVNDSFGHATGDAALAEFADRLTAVAGDGCLPARLGGDEFAVLVVGEDAAQRAGRAAEVLVRGQRAAVGGFTLTVGASAGVAQSEPGDSGSTLLRRADLAMYEAKRSGVSQAAVFRDDMAVRAARRHLLAQALPGAAQRGELELVYQPLFRLEGGCLSGAEALLRWHSPVHGQVPPAEFVPLAEEMSLIDELGDWVLTTAARQLEAWAGAGLLPPHLSVNVSPRQLDPGFPDRAVQRFAHCGVDPSRVTLEITESAMPDIAANRCVERLREAGFSIAMDDFGAGFSSLAQLAVLPVDVLKFDREFIRGVRTAEGRRIVEVLIALAADLGLVTVAEGVETAAEADVVRRAGCQLVQGFFFSRPLPAAELALLLPAAGAPALAVPRPAHDPAGAPTG